MGRTTSELMARRFPLDKERSSGGIFTPTIRHYNGRFYMVTTHVTLWRNFYVWTENPAGGGNSRRGVRRACQGSCRGIHGSVHRTFRKRQQQVVRDPGVLWLV
jgi:hypothetical protein